MRNWRGHVPRAVRQLLARGRQSESLRLAQALLEPLAPGEIDRLDLYSHPLPPFGADAAAAKMTAVAGEEPQGQTWEVVRATAERVQRADTFVFTVPMWNSGIPWR